KLTYAELNAKANSLAYKLREKGVKPDDFVALITDRSAEMVAAIYGVIKAGGAYVPIDPTYPEDRIAFMLEDSAPKAVLKFTNEAVNIPEGIEVIDLSDKSIWDCKSDDLAIVNKPSDLVYCIYTSGTTGKPKGVILENTGLVGLIKSYEEVFEMSSKDRMMQFASYCFDQSVGDIFGAMLNGAALYVVSTDMRYNMSELEAYMKSEKITVASLTPKVIRELDICGMPELRLLDSGGEAAELDVLREIAASGRKVINSYGPTEATVNTTYSEIKADTEKVVIGTPSCHTQVYIMNGSEMCGIGVPGELCIVGDGLARGYLNRPELTAEKFVKNPFGEGRMYRSGDLARWLPDGNIEYLGRIDEQVKIRGFRIELGEIESRIREIENINDCAVIAKEDASGDKAIYAYYTSERNVDISDVRNRLAESLPEYMVPAYMMQIEMFPVTRNGKLDKKALPEIEGKAAREYIAPRNEIEEKICDIFSEILNVEQVGIKDSFFELGGHSLRATRLVNRIEAETGTRIALKEVFAHPTVEQLAVLAGGESEEYVPIPKAEEKEYYPMSSAQKRTYLIQQMDPESTAYNMPGNLKLTGEIRADDLRAALQAMLDRHEILRTQFLMINGEPVQKILDHVEADFEYVTSEETDEKLIKDFLKPFDLASAKLVRMKLVNKGEYHLMMIDMHHIVGDGMSDEIFNRELMALYNGEKLEPLTHQFKDYSEWMHSRDLSGQAEYWKSQFDDEIPVLDMPTDFPRPQEQSFAGAMTSGLLDEKLSGQIKELVKKTGATEYMVFLAAAMITLSKYSRQEDIVIGSPISGRTHR
ncbi:MAG: amino acid adenylation domain-containing protein, partial [Ruminococcus sp.]|nr:amino acid adenylation domain-containing protein [Ruminococcus sp.]